jgi:hypothetical protein
VVEGSRWVEYEHHSPGGGLVAQKLYQHGDMASQVAAITPPVRSLGGEPKRKVTPTANGARTANGMEITYTLPQLVVGTWLFSLIMVAGIYTTDYLRHNQLKGQSTVWYKLLLVGYGVAVIYLAPVISEGIIRLVG